MESVQLNNDIKLVCVKASSFPQGVEQAHEQLKKSITSENERSFYGISYPLNNGTIEYLAAATQLTDDKSAKDVDIFIIQSGAFLSITLKNWKSDVTKVQQAFDQLTTDPRGDRDGYCLEEYVNEDTLRCLIPMSGEYAKDQRKEALVQEIETTFSHLYNALSAFKTDTINIVPFDGSWTVGQVAEHIIKCGSGIPDQHTTVSGRFPDEKVQSLREMFLNFDIKFEAAPFLHPKQNSHNQEDLLQILHEIEARHIATANTADLEALCTDMELPAFGYLTRYEWLRFILVHTQRHIRQIEHIYKFLAETKTV